MGTRKRRLSLYAALLLTVAALGVTGVHRMTSADAASGCSGKLIESQTGSHGGEVVLELDVYWNESTGQNCAIAYHRNSANGKAYSGTFVALDTCRKDTPNYSCSTIKES